MSQHLVFANCIPLVLKFFNQNIMAYIQSKNNIALLDFPSCVIGRYHYIQSKNNIALLDFPSCVIGRYHYIQSKNNIALLDFP